MAAPAFVATLLEALSLALDKLPFMPKRKRPEPVEPFHELEDNSSEDDDSFAPNAIPSKTVGPKRARLDFVAIGKDLLSRPAFLAGLAVLVLFVAALVTVAIVVNAEPPVSPSQAASRPSTPEGRAAAARLILPPDPALDLSPPMEREAHFPYTDADIRRLAPTHAADEIAPIAGRNDRAMDAIFGAVP